MEILQNSTIPKINGFTRYVDKVRIFTESHIENQMTISPLTLKQSRNSIHFTYCSVSKKQIDKTIERLAKPTKRSNDREESVLEKILQIDENYAMVMSLDMLSAGIHSVSLLNGKFVLVCASQEDIRCFLAF